MTKMRGTSAILIGLMLFAGIWGVKCSCAETGFAAGENEVFAIGTGPVVGGNLASAKQRAISQALKKGLENYLMHRLGSRGVMTNFQRIIQDILPRAGDVIANFNLLAEEQVGNRFTVLVRLRVNETILNEKLREAGVVFMEGPPLKVVIMVSETGQGGTYYWWKESDVNPALSPIEVVLHNVIQERGFRPLSRVLNAPEVEDDPQLRSEVLAEEHVLRWGRIFSAEVVLYGQTAVLEDDRQVSVTIEAFDVTQGIRIGQDMLFEPFPEGLEGEQAVMETLEKGVRHLFERLAPTIIRMALANRDKLNRLDITIEGLTSYKQFRIFRDFLRRDVAGVKSVRQTRIRMDSISLIVAYQGDRERFLNRLMNHEDLPFSIDFKVTEEGHIILRAL
jgi:hypothetical protein